MPHVLGGLLPSARRYPIEYCPHSTRINLPGKQEEHLIISVGVVLIHEGIGALYLLRVLEGDSIQNATFGYDPKRLSIFSNQDFLGITKMGVFRSFLGFPCKDNGGTQQ